MMKKSKHTTVHQPHDKLVKTMLSNLSIAKDLMEVLLPSPVQELIDLSGLEKQANSFVDAEHRLSEVDVLFKAPCKNNDEEAYIWVLLEQQRNPDVWLPMRVFHYIGLIWEHVRKATKNRAGTKALPFIYPMVISNASKPYAHSLNLRDLIQPEAAQPLFDDLFKTPIQLLDLAAINDEELRKTTQERVQAYAFLLTMKHVFDEALQEVFNTKLLSCYQALDEMGQIDAVADMLYYLYNTGNLKNDTQFWSVLHQRFSRDTEEKVMTLGQQAIQRAVDQAEQRAVQQTKQAVQQAVQQTEQETKQKAAQATAQAMFAEGCDTAFVAKITKLPLDMLNKMKQDHH